MFEAAIFDWDGTLADTRKVIVASFQQTLTEIGINITNQYIERRIGIGAAETFREILKDANRPVNEALVKQLVERKSQIQVSLKDQVQLFSGVWTLLKALQGKVKVGLASMNSRLVIDELVKAQGLTPFFQATITGDNVLRSKPDPEIFLKCTEQLNVLPRNCVVVEDSIFGVKAAKAAGMACIAVTTGVYGKNELEEAHPDLVVATLNSLDVLKFILSQ
jgi:beta-phosphoglucomutase